MSALLDLQSAVAAAVLADTALCTRGLEVVVEDKGDVVRELDAMQAKLGVCAIVSTADFKNDRESGNPHGDCSLAISVLENVLLNRGKPGFLSSTEAAEGIAVLLHTNLELGLSFDRMDPLPVTNGVAGYELNFKKRITLTKEGA